MLPIIQRHADEYPNLVYVPQDSWDLATLLWADPIKTDTPTFRLVSPDSPLHQRDQIRFPLDPKTWVQYLREFDFAFGTRIHGIVAAILAGTPAMLLAHDSRTLELADYHSIPYRRIDQVTPDVTAAELQAEADYTAFHANATANFARFTDFLEKNSLAHIYQDGKASSEFDERLSSAQLPPLVHPVLAEDAVGRLEILSRLRWLRQGTTSNSSSDQYRFEPQLPHSRRPELTLNDLHLRQREAQGQLTATATELAALRQELGQTQAELNRQKKVIKRLDVPIAARARRYLARVRRRAKSRIQRGPDSAAKRT